MSIVNRFHTNKVKSNVKFIRHSMSAIAQIIYERKAFSPVNLNPILIVTLAFYAGTRFSDIFTYGQSGLVKFKIVLDENSFGTQWTNNQ